MELILGSVGWVVGVCVCVGAGGGGGINHTREGGHSINNQDSLFKYITKINTCSNVPIYSTVLVLRFFTGRIIRATSVKRNIPWY